VIRQRNWKLLVRLPVARMIATPGHATMKRTPLLIALAALALVAAVGRERQLAGGSAVVKAAPVAAAPSPPQPALAAVPASGNATSVAVPVSPSDPRFRTYLDRQDFERRARELFSNADQLDATTRARQAKALEDAIARAEAAGELSAGESLLMRTELIRATEPNELAQAEAITELAERYRARAERRMADHAAHPDPAFDAYKRRERAVVDEVLALDTIPGGLTRDEYLRLRLQQARTLTLDTPGSE
jgi:hypothetical protein